MLIRVFAVCSLAALAAGQARADEQVIAGGPGDFMRVRHLTLRGSSFEIGEKLAELARDRHGVTPPTAREPLRVRAQNRYFARNWPRHFERMRGAAAAFGIELERGTASLAGLLYNLGRPGCSVTFFPPGTTTDGIGVLSRNYDFSTGAIDGRPAAVPATSEPYLLELHPEDGYASLAMCSYDLLAGAIDGINEHGLCAALLADGELMAAGLTEPASDSRAGLSVLQAVRHLLDECRDVEEAKVALLANKHYYGSIPCHYIVADAGGRSFIWEFSAGRNREFIFDGDGSPQSTTNFMRHRHPDDSELPAERPPSGSFNRYRKIAATIEGFGGKLTIDQIKRAQCSVAPTGGVASPSRPVGRTLWHALYLPERRGLSIDFYLGDDPEGDRKIRRSGYLEFTLSARK